MTANKKPTGKAAEVPFETAIGKLESIVGQLEEGELALEKSLELFEEGVSLSRACLQRLDAAERRIEILLKDDATGEDQASPFGPSEES